MAQQTAMQKLLTNLKSIGITVPQGVEMVYLQMEKEQTIDAFEIGWKDEDRILFGEEYYNKTFTSTPQGESPSAIETGQS